MTKAVKKVESTEVTTLSPDAVIQVIERAATNPDVDIDKMERLMDMHTKLMDRQSETAFATAMAAAQKEVRAVLADRHNLQTKSDYSSYNAMDKMIRPIYTKHGFAISFDTSDSPRENEVRVSCDVMHSGGHTKQYHIDMPADGKGAKGSPVMTKTHAVGSGVAYGMRYLLKMIWNIATSYDPDDDDGNAAGTVCISEDQAADLEALISEVGADKELFLRWCKADSVEEIPAHKFPFCLNRLKEMRNESV